MDSQEPVVTEEVKKEVKPKRAKKAKEEIGFRMVKPVNFKADRRKPYIMVADVKDNSQVWLVEAADVPGDVAFKVTDTDLALFPKPYDFTAEIEKEMPTTQDVLCALWLKGILTKDDLSDVAKVRNALARVLPSPTAFVKYAREG